MTNYPPGASADQYEAQFPDAEQPECALTNKGHDFSNGGQCECGRFACNEQGCEEPDAKGCEGFCFYHYHLYDTEAA